MRSLVRTGLLLIAALLLSLPVAGCGGGDEEEADSSATASGGTSEGDRTGVTDTEILLGATFPLSNTPAAAYAPISDAIRAYFAYVNDQGGVHGRKISWIVQDDHYSPPDAMEGVRKLVEQDGVFAMVGSLGDPCVYTTMRYLADRNIPNLFVAGGIREFTEPVVESRFACSADYWSEARAMGQYIIDNYDGKKLGMLVQSDEAGRGGEKLLREALQDSNVEIVATEYYDMNQFDMTGQTQRLHNANPDVVGLLSHPAASGSAIKVARELLNWDVPFTTTGASLSEATIALAGAENAEGLVSVSYLKMSTADDPEVEWHKQMMAKYAPGIQISGMTLYGQTLAELAVKALENAGPDLTREGVIEGAEQIRDFCCRLCLTPVNLSEEDHRSFETEYYHRVENGKWVPFGAPISYESSPGESKTCEAGS